MLVLLHGPGCPDCARIADELVAHRDDWEGWGMGLLVLHSEDAGFPDAAFPQGRDPEGVGRQRFGGDGADVVLACLDHRRLFMDGWALRHPEPVDWREVAETARWVAIQEPECGACVIAPGWDED